MLARCLQVMADSRPMNHDDQKPDVSTASAPADGSAEVVELITKLRKYLTPDEIEKRAQVPYRTWKRWLDDGPSHTATALIRLQRLERELAREAAADFGITATPSP